MRALLGLVLLATACGSVETAAVPKQPVERAPDVIVITVDTLRADRVGAYGHAAARTPAIDALAARGARFANAITPQPRTTPGLASLMTGLWPHHHGAREVHFPLHAGTPLAEALLARGYATRAVSANIAAGPATHLDRGFETFELRSGHEASEITDLAIGLATAAPGDRPLLLWAHYYDPHAPYAAPAAAEPPATPTCHAVQRETEWGRALTNRDGISERALPECARAYDAEVAWADRQIARLLERLEALGRQKRAFIVFGSDHGEGMGERGLWYEHGPNVHASNLDIPLSIAGPGIAPDRVVEQAASLVDVAPTLYELLEIPEAERPAMDGRSLAALVRGEETAPAEVCAESSDALTPLFGEALVVGRAGLGYCINGPRFALCWESARDTATLHDRVADLDHLVDVAAAHPAEYEVLLAARHRWARSGGREHAISDGRFKLVSRPRLEGGYARSLFDRSTDPAETHDVAAEHPDVVRRLTEALTRWEAGMPNHEPVVLSPEQEEALRALGYIE